MAEPEYEEITLADLVDTLLKRKVVIVVVLLLAVGVAAAMAARESTTHVAEASFVPLGWTTITTSYLDSRQAARDIVAQRGDELRALLGEENDADLVAEIRDMTRVTWTDPVETDRDPQQVLVTIRARGDTEEAAQAVAQAYLDILPTIRPVLQDLHEDSRFNFYFASTEHLPLNVTEARELARQDAEQERFWLIFDDEAEVTDTEGPNYKLNLALGLVLGLMLGVFAAFTTEWWSNYRMQRTAQTE